MERKRDVQLSFVHTCHLSLSFQQARHLQFLHRAVTEPKFPKPAPKCSSLILARALSFESLSSLIQSNAEGKAKASLLILALLLIGEEGEQMTALKSLLSSYSFSQPHC